MRDSEIVNMIAPFETYAKERARKFNDKGVNPATQLGTFDPLAFMYHKFMVQNIAESMKLNLEAFEKKNPDRKEEIEFATDKYKSLLWTRDWLDRLQGEYEAERKVSFYHRMDNLTLLGKINDLGKLVQQQKLEIETLKKNIENQFLGSA